MYKLSPSDFKYLWEECPYCFYQKVKNNNKRPAIPFPSIFTKMSGILQKSLMGRSPDEFFQGLPKGKFVLEEGYLKSKPSPSGKSYINGRFDLLVRFEDGTCGVIDAKMVDPKSEGLDKFERQLHAYKYALENPEKGEPVIVSKLGLLIFAPTAVAPKDGYFYFQAKPTWMEIPINMDGYFKFIEKVEALLDGPIPACGNPCGFCAYKATSFE